MIYCKLFWYRIIQSEEVKNHNAAGLIRKLEMQKRSENKFVSKSLSRFTNSQLASCHRVLCHDSDMSLGFAELGLALLLPAGGQLGDQCREGGALAGAVVGEDVLQLDVVRDHHVGVFLELFGEGGVAAVDGAVHPADYSLLVLEGRD